MTPKATTTRAMTRRASQRGFALLIVLWSLALVALIGTQVTSAGRTEARIAGNLRAEAVAEAAADAAIQVAGLHLLDASAARWHADGTVYPVELPQASARVTIAAEGRKLPLNTAPTLVLAALARGLGAAQPVAARIADEIGDWRSPADFPLRFGAKAPQYRAAGRLYGPPNRPFRTVSELRLLLAMTPELYARLAPHLSTYTESTPDLKTADPQVRAVLQSLRAEGVQPLAFDEPGVFRVTAAATGREGGRFTRVAVIRLAAQGANAPPTRPFDVLEWSDGSGTDEP